MAIVYTLDELAQQVVHLTSEVRTIHRGEF